MKGNITPEETEAARLEVGRRLKELRENKGLTQEEFAAVSGIERSTVSKVETGRWAASLDMLTLFCKHLEAQVTIS